MIRLKENHGFSLVELSIVLVILGLLTGGILAGQSLIRASELRAITAEYQRYSASALTFRDKYFAIPGDFRDATKFWARLNTNADCVSNSGLAVAGTPGTCDGNGDGLINDAAGATLSGERLQIWRQLALAGLIEGSYTGLAGTGGGNHHILGTNSPRSKISNSGWGVANMLTFPYLGNADWYAGDYGNHFRFGGQHATGGPLTAVLKPEEAWNIDVKLDDGKPAQGLVMATYWNGVCAAADDGTNSELDLAASYRLTDTTARCILNFVRQF